MKTRLLTALGIAVLLLAAVLITTTGLAEAHPQLGRLLEGTPTPTPDDACACESAMYLATIAAGTGLSQASVISNTATGGVVWSVDQTITWADVTNWVIMGAGSLLGTCGFLLYLVKH